MPINIPSVCSLIRWVAGYADATAGIMSDSEGEQVGQSESGTAAQIVPPSNAAEPEVELIELNADMEVPESATWSVQLTRDAGDRLQPVPPAQDREL